MKQLVALLVLLCLWESLAAPSPQYQYSSYSHQSGYSGSNYVSNGMYGHGQYQNIGGHRPNMNIGASRHYHSDPRCETFCRKHSWTCNSQGLCTIISKRSCLLRVCPNYIPPVTVVTCEFRGNGTKEVLGKLTIKQKNDAAYFTGELSGLSKGLHGIHVHQHGDLGDNCNAAGGHFNPDENDHGGPHHQQNRHVGDLGNVEVDEEGVVRIDMKDKMALLSGTNSIIGKAIVIHERDDKFTGGVNGTGDAGARAGCCLIVKAQSFGSSGSHRPTVHPTRPTVRPTRPTVHPTRPTVHPTRPTVHPTDTGSGFFIDNNGAEANNSRKEEDDQDDNSDNVVEASGDGNDNEEGLVWDW